MKNSWKALRILLGLALLISGVIGIGTAINNMNLEKETQEQQEQAMVDTLKSGYDMLEIGMSYEECVSILGTDGELFSETESEYFGKNEVYLWKPYEDALFVGIEAYFTDGKLTDKTWVDA